DTTYSNGEYNGAYVLMQYFGYLRRDPDSGGYTFWKDQIDQMQPNVPATPEHRNAMVWGFMMDHNGGKEYHDRFYSPPFPVYEPNPGSQLPGGGGGGEDPPPWDPWGGNQN